MVAATVVVRLVVRFDSHKLTYTHTFCRAGVFKSNVASACRDYVGNGMSGGCATCRSIHRRFFDCLLERADASYRLRLGIMRVVVECVPITYRLIKDRSTRRTSFITARSVTLIEPCQ